VINRLEHFGTPCYEPEDIPVGYCRSCQNDMYEELECDCGMPTCEECRIVCDGCGEWVGCKQCMVQNENDLDWYCVYCLEDMK
jgi:hypothetical protein